MKNYSLSGVFLGVVAVFCAGVILLELRAVLLPFAVAMLLSIIFKPIVLFFKGRRVPTAVSLVSVLITFFLVLFLIGWTVYASSSVMVRELPRYESQVGAMIDNAERSIVAWAAGYNVNLNEFSWSDAIDMSSLTTALTTGVGSFFNFIGFLFLVLMFMMFILAGSGDLAAKVRHAFPPSQSARLAKIVANVDLQVRTYLVTKTVLSLGTGFFSYLALVIVGVDFALVWGFLAFILNFIPNFGSLVAVVAPVLLSALQFESFGVALLVLALLFGIQTVFGNILEPKMMGFQLNQSPLVVLVSLIFWGWLWGIWGMVIAVPLTATIKILFENIEPLRPISVLMGDWREPVPEDATETSRTDSDAVPS